jgi:ATP-dependent helicase HrpB
MPETLPVDEILPQLLVALQNPGCAVLIAPPGAGKTTRVPPAILQSGIAGTQQILILQPRRIAARSAATRMASERKEHTGETIGFQVRFEESLSPRTRILAVTEGILLRKLQDDPFLENVSTVIFDEFHERRLDSDLALAMVRRVRQTVRPDLKIIVMSATLDPAPIASFLDHCPVLQSQGRQFPVSISYLPRTDRRQIPDAAADGVETALRKSSGDILVFLPGVAEIHRTAERLQPTARSHSLSLLPLYGDMTSKDQDLVLLPSPQRKVVLATNVAETSITIDGIEAVVDTGFARQMLFDPAAGLDRLQLTPISKASADQRAGRAGRTRPGFCLRLWDEQSHRVRPAAETPEVLRVDLSSAVLRLMVWGEHQVDRFPWFQPPNPETLEHALKLLHLLGALNQNHVTSLGFQLARLPAAPRIARLLLEAAHNGSAKRAALLAAMLAERDPFLRYSDHSSPTHNSQIHTRTLQNSRSDVLDRLHALERWFDHKQTHSDFGEIHRGAASTILQSANQFHKILHAEFPGQTYPNSQPSDPDTPQSDETLLQALAAGFPDRLAKRRESGSDKALMVGGRGVKLSRRSSVRQAPLFLCIDIDGGGTDAEVRQASEVLRHWLPQNLLHESEELFFHPSRKQVVARKRLAFHDLVLEETPVPIASPEKAAQLLFQAAAPQLNAVMPDNDENLRSFLQRANCLRLWIPELNLPTLDDSALQNTLKSLCFGKSSFTELQNAPWLETLHASLDYQQLQTIEREAPDRIQVPSGSRIRLEYSPGRPPILAVRIQELFGLKQTPRIAQGRVPVLLHLLAPNFRPQQVTDDLASFWTNTYPEVRKELKRRYPKHPWPDDPANATPVRKG